MQRVYIDSDGVVARRGSRKVRAGDACVAHILSADERVTPDVVDVGREVPLTPAGFVRVLSHDQDARMLHAVSGSFQWFLQLWWFVAEGSLPQLLGPNMWESQRLYAEAAASHDWVLYLKSRQLGLSTLEAAFDVWRMRFGPPGSRIHCFSLRDSEAKEILEECRWGHDHLPDWMKLPTARETASRIEYVASPNDRRIMIAYPASRTTSRSATCTHAHVDELAVVPDPGQMLQSIVPTITPGGTFHILSTAIGPADDFADLWRKCVAGDGAFHPVFVSSLTRPDRTPEWVEEKRRSLPKVRFMREFPQTPEDALAGGGETAFDPEDVDATGVDARPPSPAQRGRRYVKAWDIGVKDATVGTALDCTEDLLDIADQRRFVGLSYPQIVLEIERMHRDYPGPTIIEANSMGLAVIQHLSIPTDQVIPFTTTAVSKARIIENLALHLQNQTILFDHDAFPQLAKELYGYTIPDEHVVNDCVMSLAIALDQASKPFVRSRVLTVLSL